MIQNKMFELVFQGEKPDSSEALSDIKAVIHKRQFLSVG